MPVLKDKRKNIALRRRVYEMTAGDREEQEQWWTACARDPLLWVNLFVLTYDPRVSASPELPFITYPYQDESIRQMAEWLGENDIFVEKSRDMGASWICCLLFYWAFQFRPGVSFLVGSRKQELVDKKGAPATLFWKLDYLRERQPLWMQPTIERNVLHMRNLDNGSVIDGESTNENFGRAGRSTGVLLDEFASVENGYEILAATGDVTNTRIFNSTPKGMSNAFYEVRTKCPYQIRMHWTQHPEKAKGLYYDDLGNPRSPWYDTECARRVTRQEIAQELDIDYLGSDYLFFEPTMIEELRTGTAQAPAARGTLVYDTVRCTPLHFAADSGGRLLLWEDYGGAAPTPDEYVIGADIATGVSAGFGGAASAERSKSVLSVAKVSSGEKVAELAVAGMAPHTLAEYAVSLCRWFAKSSGGGAFLLWEANGPGRLFGDRVVELGYRNVYYRRREESLKRKTTDTPGWWSTRESKYSLLGSYREALAKREFLNRSLDALNECRQYVFELSGGIVHSRSAGEQDPSQAKANHGDRVIADALAWWGVRELRQGYAAPQRDEVRPGTLAWRHRQARMEAQKLRADGW